VISENITMAVACAGIIAALFFRHIISRIVLSILSLLILAFVIAAIGSIAIAIHGYAGMIPAIVSVSIMLFLSYFLFRTRNSSGAHDEDRDGSDDWRRRDDQLREDRRQQQIHEDARRRNPW
jgi:membrane protein implicated in regulation of membrane protease activity